MLLNDENRYFEGTLPPGVGVDCIIKNLVIKSKIGWFMVDLPSEFHCIVFFTIVMVEQNK